METKTHKRVNNECGFGRWTDTIMLELRLDKNMKAKMKVSGSVERSHNMNTTRNCQMREEVLGVSKKFVM